MRARRGGVGIRVVVCDRLDSMVSMGKQSDADIFWRPCVNFGRSRRVFRVEFFFFAAIGDFARARGGGGVKRERNEKGR